MRHNAFIDGTGKLRVAMVLPPLLLLEYLDWLTVMEDQLRQSGGTIESLYLSDPLFQQICDRCLELHGIPAHCVSLDVALDLIFLHLPALNKPTAQATGDGETVSVQDWAYSLVAALLELEGTQGAIAVASTVPADQLDGILKAHAKLAKPKDDVPLDAPEYKELLEELDKDLLGVPLPP